MNKKLIEIAEWFQNFGIILYQVGGSVRDEIMGLPIEDIDICVVGAETAMNTQFQLDFLLNQKIVDNVTSVHGSFPIWIVEIDGEKYEFAMARTERKVGQTRQEFECEVNNITVEQDLERRDLTINAIAKNLVTGEIVDPFDGRYDIHHKIAAPVSTAFNEDPLRVYRTARFIAKFELTATPLLRHYCRELNPSLISNERVGMELKKLFKRVEKPSLFFNFLKDIGWLKYHFAELEACIGVPQSPTHHPEGDVYIHTMYCLDATNVGDLLTRAAILCHDLGKVTTTEVNSISWENNPEQVFFEPLKITAYGHEEAGMELADKMLKRIKFMNHKFIGQVKLLVKLHMIRTIISKGNQEKILRRTIRELMNCKLTYIDLCKVIYSDLKGRPPKEYPTFINLWAELDGARAHELENGSEMIPIVTGKELIKLGMEPTEEMGEIIDKALELQDRATLTKDNWKKVLKGCRFKFFNQKNNNEQEETRVS